MISRLVRLVAAAAVLVLAGCSGGDPAPAPSTPAAPEQSVVSVPAEPTTTPTDPAPTDPAPTDTAPTDTTPASECLTGRYRLARFVGIEEAAPYGTGEGGDVVVEFDDGAYALTGNGKRPITLTLAGSRAEMVVDGKVQGKYSSNGSLATFTVGRATGSARLSSAGEQRTLSMNQVSNVLAPDGPAVLACGKGQLIVRLDFVRLDLERP